MGWSNSFLAVKGRDRGELLAELGLLDTGEPETEHWSGRGKISAASLPNGWLLIWSNDFDYVTPELMAEVSDGAQAIGWNIEDHVMASSAWGFRNGDETWAVLYENAGETASHEVETRGKPPAAFGRIYKAALAEQTKGDAEEHHVDYVWDVPADLAASVCGFRYDEMEFDWGKPEFTVLRPVRLKRREPMLNVSLNPFRGFFSPLGKKYWEDRDYEKYPGVIGRFFYWLSTRTIRIALVVFAITFVVIQIDRILDWALALAAR